MAFNIQYAQMNRLAILICHLPERHDKLRRLRNVLDPQIERYKDRVFCKVNDAGRGVMSTGRKRNQLIEETESEYLCFCDDDDMIPAYYIDEIVKAMDQNPDVITFNGWIETNGANRRTFTIRLGSEYYENAKDPLFFYHRFPNHLAVMKRSCVHDIKFPDITKMEDFQWASQILKKNRLKSEVHIPMDMYYYMETVEVRPQSVYSRRNIR